MLAKNEKGAEQSRAKSAQSGLEQPARSIDSGTDSATGRHSLWPPSAMQMICRGRLLPACHSCLPSATVHLPLCMPGASNVPLPALATCWVAVRQKLKPNNDFQSKQQLGRQATLRRLQLEQRFNAIRFDSGLVAKESHNSRPVIMRQMRAALAARSSTSPSPSSSPLRLPLLLALPTL